MSTKEPNRKGNTNEGLNPPQRNDADCWNCAGITHYSDILKLQGKRPKCYGIEYKAAKPIQPDIMRSLENLPVISKDTRIYLIGLSQSSVRMHRIGQSPIVKFGIQVVVNSSSNSSSDSKKDQAINDKEMKGEDEKIVDKNNERKDSLRTPSSDSISKIQKRSDELEQPNSLSNLLDHKELSKFLQSFRRSCSRLFDGMGKVYSKSIDDLPNRFEKSAIRLIGSCNKTLIGIFHSVFGPDDTPPNR